MTDIRISWSGLRTHTECHQKSFLQRTGKRAKVEDIRNFFPGTITDRVVRDWLMMPEYTPGLMVDMVEEKIMTELELAQKEGKQVRWKSKDDRDAVIADCQEAVRNIEPYLFKYVIPYEYDVDFKFSAPLKARHPLTGEPEVITLIGFMDIIVKRPDDTWHVYDVKHTRDEYYWKKTRGQLLFYDLAVEIMFGQTTASTALLQPLCKEKMPVFELHDNERQVLLKSVLGMAEDIWLGDKTVNPEANCAMCNVKHACSKFTPVVASDGKRRVSLLRGDA